MNLTNFHAFFFNFWHFSKKKMICTLIIVRKISKSASPPSMCALPPTKNLRPIWISYVHLSSQMPHKRHERCRPNPCCFDPIGFHKCYAKQKAHTHDPSLQQRSCYINTHSLIGFIHSFRPRCFDQNAQITLISEPFTSNL